MIETFLVEVTHSKGLEYPNQCLTHTELLTMIGTWQRVQRMEAVTSRICLRLTVFGCK